MLRPADSLVPERRRTPRSVIARRVLRLNQQYPRVGRTFGSEAGAGHARTDDRDIEGFAHAAPACPPRSGTIRPRKPVHHAEHLVPHAIHLAQQFMPRFRPQAASSAAGRRAAACWIAGHATSASYLAASSSTGTVTASSAPGARKCSMEAAPRSTQRQLAGPISSSGRVSRHQAFVGIAV